MKKLTRKLLLSSFALALALVTLTTTTFAWYTTNNTVDASGVVGKTQGGVTTSLEISKSKDSGYGPTITIDNVNVSNLVPLQHVVTGEVASLKNVGGTAANTGYIQFTVYVRTSTTLENDKPVYLKNLTITNVTDTLPTKQILSATGGFEGKTIGDTYTVDVVRALSFAVSGTASTIGTKEYSYGETVYTPKTDFFTENGTVTADAKTYYQAVMSEPLTDKSSPEQTLGEDTQILAATITGADKASEEPSKGVPVAITIWLDGWDKYCFDACQGQTFNISFELTTDANLIDFIPKNNSEN